MDDNVLMVKKININDFIDGYKKLTNKDERSVASYVKKNIKVVSYINFASKIAIAEKIVDSAFHSGKDKNRTHINSNTLYFLRTIALISNWTNIQLSDDKLNDYDLLASTGLLQIVIKSIPDAENAEFQAILDAAVSDYITNEYEPHAFIKNQVDRICSVFGAFTKPVLNELMDKLQNLDKAKISDKISEIAETYTRQQ